MTACAVLPDTATAGSNDPVLAEDKEPAETEPGMPSHVASFWAMLIARIYQVCPLVFPQCGSELTIVAFLTEADSIQRILNHIGEPAVPPRIAPARAPPGWLDADFDQTSLNESETSEPIPELEFDQTLSC